MALMAIVAQLVRALDCGSKGRGFESRRSPHLPYLHYLHMTLIEALLLGVLQGITEFFPISSSGHLLLLQSLFGLKDLDQLVLFDLIIHLGTLGSIFFVFWEKIRRCLRNFPQIISLGIAILPLFPLLLIIKPVKHLFTQTQYLGPFFLLTAAILYSGIRFGRHKTTKSWWDAFCIGLWQTLAILPGVSRSGSTVSGARLLGWNYQESLSFSFLLAIPTILGGIAIESLQLWQGTANLHPQVFSVHYLTGFFSSFAVGCLALKFLIRLGTSDKWMIFVWYCLILGICTTVYFTT